MQIEEKDGYTLHIEQDKYPPNPREEFDHLGTMVCWHRRYELGDENPAYTPHCWLLQEFGDLEDDSWWYWAKDHNLPNNVLNRLLKRFDQQYIWLPLYIYDHSGIAMSTESFTCPWDSGQVGFIYVSKDRVRKEYKWKRLTKKRVHQIENILESEVEEYHFYLCGEVYCAKVEDEDGNTVDSVCGLYGWEYAVEHGKEMLDYASQR